MEQAALAAQWTAVASDIAPHVEALNKHLASSTYIAGNAPTDADSVVFKSIIEIASKWNSAKDVAAHRHILRWADLIQNTIVTDSATKLALDYQIELPREIKEKPKKKGAEAPAAAEPAKKQQAQPPKGKPTDPEAIAKAKAAKEAKKAAKAKANAEAQAKSQAEAALPPSPSLIDLRVGFIEKAIKHPDADSLYVSTIQMGDETGPRTICSGLVKHFSLEEMQERYVIVVANLKPVTMRGIKSFGMVLCAANADGKVEFVNPPEGSKAGEKVFFEGHDGVPEKQLNPKKKIWEAIQPHFTSLEDFTIVYQDEGKPDAKLITKSGGVCKNSTIIGADIR